MVKIIRCDSQADLTIPFLKKLLLGGIDKRLGHEESKNLKGYMAEETFFGSAHRNHPSAPQSLGSRKGKEHHSLAEEAYAESLFRGRSQGEFEIAPMQNRYGARPLLQSSPVFSPRVVQSSLQRQYWNQDQSGPKQDYIASGPLRQNLSSPGGPIGVPFRDTGASIFRRLSLEPLAPTPPPPPDKAKYWRWPSMSLLDRLRKNTFSKPSARNPRLPEIRGLGKNEIEQYTTKTSDPLDVSLKAKTPSTPLASNPEPLKPFQASDEEDCSDSDEPNSTFARIQNQAPRKMRQHNQDKFGELNQPKPDRGGLRTLDHDREVLRSELHQQSFLALSNDVYSSSSLKATEIVSKLATKPDWIDYDPMDNYQSTSSLLFQEMRICRNIALIVRRNIGRLKDAELIGEFISILILDHQRSNEKHQVANLQGINIEELLDYIDYILITQRRHFIVRHFSPWKDTVFFIYIGFDHCC